MTLYLKYRPQKIEELDILEVRESLTKIVKSGNIPHAFLFSGPKGTGKTSAARIIAKIVNCEKNAKKLSEPCNKCEECTSISRGNNIDVIELDAASHRGIDDVRALRDAVKLAPAKSKKKVYIIDEAHMLTAEASNALLKTLEEPPDHVIFILATTNPEKLTETIRSRTTIISFRKATKDEIVRSLLRPVKGEKIKIGKEALQLIAQASEGSFRDATKILEQLILEEKDLNEASVEEFLFKRKTFKIEEFLDLLAKKDVRKALEEVEGAVKKGVAASTVIEALLARARLGILAKAGVGSEDLESFSQKDLLVLIELFTKAIGDLKTTPIEQLPVEIAVIEWCENPDSGKQTIQSENTPTPEVKPQKEIKSAPEKSAPIKKLEEINEEVWKRILASVKVVNTTIEALLRAARPIGFDGRSLTLGVFYNFHKERLEDGRNRRILEEVVAQVMGAPVRVLCTLTEAPAKKAAEVAPREETVLTEGDDKDIIKIAEEIFQR